MSEAPHTWAVEFVRGLLIESGYRLGERREHEKIACVACTGTGHIGQEQWKIRCYRCHGSGKITETIYFLVVKHPFNEAGICEFRATGGRVESAPIQPLLDRPPMIGAMRVSEKPAKPNPPRERIIKSHEPAFAFDKKV